MKDVGIIFDKSGKGGGIYNLMVVDVLKETFCIETYEIIRSQQNRLYNFSKLYHELMKLDGQKEIWIRTSNPIITLPFDKTQGKNIAIIHHIDNSQDPVCTKTLNNFLTNLLMRNLNLVEKIVVVSQFWRERFESLGYDSIEVIYNPFDLEEFTFSNDDIDRFKEKYQLSGKPIIYLGNCQKAKGVVEAYEALKGLDAHFITSGKKDVVLPTFHLNVNYREYLTLLKASSVAIAMSKFNEGWCRTAHEAMLCKTPVVGSGMGGMGELLRGGKQIICPDFSNLKDCVKYAMGNSNIGEAGYAYASQYCFTLDCFKNKWVNLLNEI